MVAHEHLNGTMNRFYVDWVNDSRTPPYIRTILGHFRVYWSNWVRLHRMVSRVIHAIHVPRNLLRYAWDNFRTKYKSVFLGPVFVVGFIDFVCLFQSNIPIFYAERHIYRNNLDLCCRRWRKLDTRNRDIVYENIKKSNKKIEKLVRIY